MALCPLIRIIFHRLLRSVFLIPGVVFSSITRCFCHFCAALTFRDSGAKIISLSPLHISIHIFAFSPYLLPWFKYSDNATWRYSWPECLTYSTFFSTFYGYLPIFLGCTDLPRDSTWFPDWLVSVSFIVSFSQQFCWWFICCQYPSLLSSSCLLFRT